MRLIQVLTAEMKRNMPTIYYQNSLFFRFITGYNFVVCMLMKFVRPYWPFSVLTAVMKFAVS